MYVVGFNGPPYCGKDTAANMLMRIVEDRHTIPVKVVPLSQPLREIAQVMTGWAGRMSGPNYDIFKTTHFDAFGKDGRQVMIDVSECFLKPRYGIHVMAEMLIQRNQNFDGLIILSDSGFQCEVGPLESHYGQDNCYFVRLHRNGCTFDGDSRERVMSTHDTDVENNGTPDELMTEVQRIYGRLVNKMRWNLS